MTRYLAFLRGINVGGHRKIVMANLRAAVAALGCTEVESFIQSGNVIFTSDHNDAAVLEHRLEDQIRQVFGFDVPAMVRTAEEVVAVVGAEPFGTAADHPEATVYIGFLQQPASVDGSAILRGYQGPIDTVHVAGRHVYWLRRRDLGESVVTLDRVEKALATAATFRNQVTLRKLVAKHLA
jgi:uncharacterized protein (DUF1697 family)